MQDGVLSGFELLDSLPTCDLLQCGSGAEHTLRARILAFAGTGPQTGRTSKAMPLSFATSTYYFAILSVLVIVDERHFLL